MNATEFDEVYFASLKEIFKEFDDEIIWNALFEHGYKKKEYQAENVINYLLELSEDRGKNKNENKFTIPEKNYGIINIDELNNDESDEEVLENTNLFDSFFKIINYNDGYKKINDN